MIEGAADIDVDYINANVLPTFLAQATVVELASVQHIQRLTRFTSRTPAKWIGMQGRVQLTVSPATFIEQRQHADVIEMLVLAGVSVVMPQYVRFDDREDESARNMSPVAFAIASRGVSSDLLAAALQAAGVNSIRLYQFHMKLALARFMLGYERFLVRDDAMAIDVSSNSRVAAACVPLVRAYGAPGAMTLPLLGRQGLGFGTAFGGHSRVVDGVDVHALFIYPSSLVHTLKSNGLTDELLTPHNVHQAREAREKLLDFARLFLTASKLDDLMQGVLRYEVRCVVDWSTFTGEIAELVRLVAVSTLPAATALYHDRLQLDGCLVSRAAYRSGLEEIMTRITQPKFKVGYAAARDRYTVINAVKLRLADLQAQMGLHVGARFCNLVASALTWTVLDPTAAEVRAGGKVWQLDEIVEPDAPPRLIRHARVPEKRAYRLPEFGDRPTSKTLHSIVADILEGQRCAETNVEPQPPIMVSIVTPLGRLAEATGERAITNAEMVRLQMQAMLKLYRGPHGLFQARKNSVMVRGCSAKTEAELFDHMFARHRNDWQDFDFNDDYANGKKAKKRK